MKYPALFFCFFIFVACNSKKQHRDTDENANLNSITDTLNLPYAPEYADSIMSNTDKLIARLLNTHAITLLTDSFFFEQPDFIGNRTDSEYWATAYIDTFRANTHSILFYSDQDQRCDVYIDGYKFDCNSIYTNNNNRRAVNPYDMDVYPGGGLLYYAFKFRNKTYVYFRAGWHNCNGSGCSSGFNFIYNTEKKTLSVFEFSRIDAEHFIGDADGDDNLDIVYVDNLGPAPFWPRDTTMGYKMVLYSEDKNGNFKPKNDKHNKPYCLDAIAWAGLRNYDSSIIIQGLHWPRPVDTSRIQ